ncbi:putative NADH dehydrogenase [ubiquinone] 1 alpha subcomplex subunit 1-like protein [Tanacetum coccineum]
MSTGLIISKTKTIQSFLATSSNNTHLSQDLRDIAASSSLSDDGSISYKSLRSIWLASDPLTRPDLSVLLSGSGFVFTSPKPREKSEELKARLRKFEEAAERKAYQELVKDITPKVDETEPFSSYKDQIGFGNDDSMCLRGGSTVASSAGVA